MKAIKKQLIITLQIVSVIFFTSCKKNDDDNSLSDESTNETQVIANFETSVLYGENQGIVEITNTSENATHYEWIYPNALVENIDSENPTFFYLENGTYPIELIASNGTDTDTHTVEITINEISDNNGHTPYRYLENDGIFMYYETNQTALYESLIPDEFSMPDRMLVFTFIMDLYELDYGVTPYKENAIFILVEHEGEEFWHCVYMPVTDEQSMWSGILGLGLPKTMGEINFTRDTPLYYGDGKNFLGGTMDLSVNTSNFTIDNDVKEEMISLSKIRSLQIRNGQVVIIGKTGDQNSVLETAEQFPNLLTLKFGEGSISTNTDSIVFYHPLDLKPTHIIGSYYLKNTVPWSLTGNPF